MPVETRTQPQVITFDTGIQSDAPGASVDFADMVNLMPPRDGSSGVEPRYPIAKQSMFPAGGGLFHIMPDSDVDAINTPIRYQSMIGLVSSEGYPVAMFPFYDVVRSLPGDWENTGTEYYKAGNDPGPDPGPATDCTNPDVEWITVSSGTAATVDIPSNATKIIVRGTGGSWSAAPNNPLMRIYVINTSTEAGAFQFVMDATMYFDPDVGDGNRISRIYLAAQGTGVFQYYIETGS